MDDTFVTQSHDIVREKKRVHRGSVLAIESLQHYERLRLLTGKDEKSA